MACIITDVRMPQMSGVELIERLKALGVADPVIVITGHADVPLAIQAMKAGVADFIEKPFSDDTILAAMRAALARRRATAIRSASSASRSWRGSKRCRSASARCSTGWSRAMPTRSSPTTSAISARTVEVYRANVMTKMQAGSLSQLVRMVTIARLP